MILVEKYVAVNKGALVGTCNIRVLKWGDLLINDIKIFEKDGKRWIAFPGKEYESEGKKKYWSYLQFKDNKLMNAFQEQIFKALEEYMERHQPKEENLEEIPF